MEMRGLPNICFNELKNAIIDFDDTVISKVGIEKLSKMLLTDEEENNIRSEQKANPDKQLRRTELFLLNLSSIRMIKTRLELWLFMIDFELVERVC
jgi:hypothetical protein